ncbi:MAG: tetratricopeptide repeat protein [Acidobacteriota bacterium]
MSSRVLALVLTGLAGLTLPASARDFYQGSVNALRAHLQATLGREAGSREKIPFEIPPDLLARVRSETSRFASPREKVRTIMEIIVSKSNLGLTYDPVSTLTAGDVIERGRGNCLSLANLFVGMARASGLNACYVHVTEVERFRVAFSETRDGAVIHSTHICSGIKETGSMALIDFSPGATRQYRQYVVIDDVTALAHFYTNLAFEIGYHSPQIPPDERDGLEVGYQRKALAVKPDFYQAMGNLGAFYRRRGELDKALECFGEALRVNQDYADAYSNRASVYVEMGRPSEAVNEIRKALRLGPANPFLHYSLGRILQAAGKTEEAAECYEKAIDRAKNASFYVALGRCRLALGQKDEAIKAFRKAVELQPGHTEATRLLGLTSPEPATPNKEAG